MVQLSRAIQHHFVDFYFPRKQILRISDSIQNCLHSSVNIWCIDKHHIITLLGHCKGDCNIHIWAWFGYFICSIGDNRFYLLLVKILNKLFEHLKSVWIS